jgi:hypothetical protein
LDIVEEIRGKVNETCHYRVDWDKVKRQFGIVIRMIVRADGRGTRRVKLLMATGVFEITQLIQLVVYPIETGGERRILQL